MSFPVRESHRFPPILELENEKRTRMPPRILEFTGNVDIPGNHMRLTVKASAIKSGARPRRKNRSPLELRGLFECFEEMTSIGEESDGMLRPKFPINPPPRSRSHPKILDSRHQNDIPGPVPSSTAPKWPFLSEADQNVSCM